MDILIISDRIGHKVIIKMDQYSHIKYDGIGGVICMKNGDEIEVGPNPSEIYQKLKNRLESNNE